MNPNLCFYILPENKTGKTLVSIMLTIMGVSLLLVTADIFGLLNSSILRLLSLLALLFLGLIFLFYISIRISLVQARFILPASSPFKNRHLGNRPVRFFYGLLSSFTLGHLIYTVLATFIFTLIIILFKHFSPDAFSRVISEIQIKSPHLKESLQAMALFLIPAMIIDIVAFKYLVRTYWSNERAKLNECVVPVLILIFHLLSTVVQYRVNPESTGRFSSLQILTTFFFIAFTPLCWVIFSKLLSQANARQVSEPAVK